MTHVTEEALVLHYYGEPEGAAEIESHLAACDVCRSGYQKLQRVLNSVDSMAVPERSADYEEQVWQRVAPRLGTRRNPLNSWRQWAWIPAVAALVVAAFLAGRWQRQPATTPSAGDRVLLVAVGDHLERAQLILVELANVELAKAGTGDISFERRTAEELLGANRLFRQTAASSGDRRTEELLDQLERVLIEISHTPAQVSAVELQDLRQTIDEPQILSKVRAYQLEGVSPDPRRGPRPGSFSRDEF